MRGGNLTTVEITTTQKNITNISNKLWQAPRTNSKSCKRTSRARSARDRHAGLKASSEQIAAAVVRGAEVDGHAAAQTRARVFPAQQQMNLTRQTQANTITKTKRTTSNKDETYGGQSPHTRPPNTLLHVVSGSQPPCRIEQ